MLELLRNQLFWVLDGLRGGKVKRHYRAIAQAFEAGVFQKEKLDALLAHARQTVPAYSKLQEQPTLSDFPVVNKNIIRDLPAAYVSYRFTAATLQRVVTSGSTGTPFAVYHDFDKKRRNTADTIFFAKKAGFEVGQRLYYFKIWNNVNQKSGLLSWMQNIVAQDVTQLSDAHIGRILDHLQKDTAAKGFLGYASALESLCRYMDQNGMKPIHARVQSAIAMSEGLTAYAREAMQRHFGVACVSRYSNVENGIIAQQLPGQGTDFFINVASYWVEILKMDEDVPAEPGETGRIVVTDLYNYGMPMIRYDTGDLGAMSTNNGKPVLRAVEGRKMDAVFNTSGQLVSSFTITNNMWNYPEIKQYQFIQQGPKQYAFKLNVPQPFEREAALIAEFQRYFGTDAEFSVSYVDEIPLLHSGKRKKVMNLLN